MKMAVTLKMLRKAHGKEGVSVFDVLEGGQASLENWIITEE